MKVYFYALMAMSLISTHIYSDEPTDSASNEAEEVVVTSSILNPSRIINPLYVIDGDEIEDNATTSLGEAVDSYLGVSIADYGAAIGQPIIRGMSGPRVKVLKNGLVNRDVSGLGADHLNDIDLNDLEQVEIIKGPSSLLYANGTSGGIINVVDNCIAPKDFTKQEFIAGLETQSVNDGDSQYFNFKDNLGGFNVNVGYKKSEFGNFDIPDGIKITVEKQTILKITGSDKQQVGTVASKIKTFRKIEPYKGKGVREQGQYVMKKEGKKK